MSKVLSNNFDQCGQLAKVVKRVKPDPFTVRLSKRNFFYLHEKYVNPVQYVQQINVNLMCVDEKHALFAVTPESK